METLSGFSIYNPFGPELPLGPWDPLPADVGAEEEIRFEEKEGVYLDEDLVKQEPQVSFGSDFLAEVQASSSFEDLPSYLEGGPFCTPAHYDLINLYGGECSGLSLPPAPLDHLVCSFCNATFKKEISLKKHLKIHQYKVKQPVRLKARRKAKENAFSDKMPQVFHCSMCTYQTKRRDKLDKHIQNHVIYEGVHPCGKKRYKPDVPLRRHRHNAEEYKCNLCLYVCTVYKALKKHQNLHELGLDSPLTKISCKICGKDKESEAEMERHMRKHRGEGKSLCCDLCSFSSVQLKKVIQHRRIHTGERPHLCPFCSYRCARRDNLRAHVRRMHHRENMYIDTFIRAVAEH